MTIYRTIVDAENALGPLTKCFELDFNKYIICIRIPDSYLGLGKKLTTNKIILEYSNRFVGTDLETEDTCHEIYLWLSGHNQLRSISYICPSRILLGSLSLGTALWLDICQLVTGYRRISTIETINDEIKPKNNDGRKTCFKCGGETKEIPGFSYQTIYCICPKCGI